MSRALGLQGLQQVPMWIYDKSWSPDFKKDEEADRGWTAETWGSRDVGAHFAVGSFD